MYAQPNIEVVFVVRDETKFELFNFTLFYTLQRKQINRVHNTRTANLY